MRPPRHIKGELEDWALTPPKSEPTISAIWVKSTTGFEWRRERDLNPRVQGTVDFESTAIPGYAISAGSKPPVLPS